MNDDRWIALLRVRREETAGMIAGLLESAGIPSEVIHKEASELPVPAVETLSRHEIWVPEDRADEAREILNDSREGSAPCAACGHATSTDERICESCGAAMW